MALDALTASDSETFTVGVTWGLGPLRSLRNVGDEALSCRDLTDAVFTPAVDIVFSAVAVGVLRRQVRARWIELLGLLSFHLAVHRVVNITLFLPSF